MAMVTYHYFTVNWLSAGTQVMTAPGLIVQVSGCEVGSEMWVGVGPWDIRWNRIIFCIYLCEIIYALYHIGQLQVI